jgi:hypothetical protein
MQPDLPEIRQLVSTTVSTGLSSISPIAEARRAAIGLMDLIDLRSQRPASGRAIT